MGCGASSRRYRAGGLHERHGGAGGTVVSMGPFLTAPVETVETESGQGVHAERSLMWAIGSMQGWRREQEDAHVAAFGPPSLSAASHACFGVFDGHGGPHVSEFIANHFFRALSANDKYQSALKHPETGTGALGDALTETFCALDTLLWTEEEAPPSYRQGSCAVVSYLTPTHIIVANLGDSRAVLSADGVAKALSKDHKPSSEEERERILRCGGFVANNRVEGMLGVSRAFGDAMFKARPDSDPGDQLVSCIPDILSRRRSARDEFLIVACDGVWDVLSCQECVDLVRSRIAFYGGDGGDSALSESIMKQVCSDALRVCLALNSRDNMTLVVVVFPGCMASIKAMLEPKDLASELCRAKQTIDAIPPEEQKLAIRRNLSWTMEAGAEELPTGGKDQDASTVNSKLQ